MKKPFLHALGAALYIFVIVSVTQIMTFLLKDQNGTLIIPMVVLGLFVMSAAIMGYFFLSEPMSLLFEGKKKEAVASFAKVVGFFACFVALFALIAFLTQ